MANRYWVGGTGNWSQATHWAATSGGAGGVSVPTSADDVFIDANSGSGSYTITANNSPSNCNDFTISGLTTQTVNFSIAGYVNCYGNWSNQSTQVVFVAGGGDLYFKSTSTGKTVTTNGVILPFNVTFDGVGGGWTLGSSITLLGTRLNFSLTNGSLNLSSYTVSTPIFYSSNTNVRTLTGSGATVTCTGQGTNSTNTYLFNSFFQTNFTVSGTITVVYSYNASSAYTLLFQGVGGSGAACKLNFSVTTGSYPLNARNFINGDFTGFTGNWIISGAACQIDGNLTLGTGMTTTYGSSGSINMYIGTSNAVIRSNSVTINAPISIGGGTSRIVQLFDNLTIGSSYQFTMFECYFDLNSKTLSTGQFITGNNSTAKTIAFGASGNIICTNYGNGGSYTLNISGPITLTGSQVISLTYSGALDSYVNATSSISGSYVNLNVTSGTYTMYFSGIYNSIDFTGFSGLYRENSGTVSMYKNITISPTMTYFGTPTISFGATSGTQTITSNGSTVGFAFVKSQIGSTLSLVDNLNMTNASSTGITITGGTFDTNNKNITAGYLLSTGSLTRSVLLGNGTHSFYGTSPLTFNGTNLTLNSGTSQVNLTNTTNSATITMAFSDVSSGGITPTAYSLNNIGLNGGSATNQTYYFSRSTSITGTLSSNKTVAYTIQFTGYSNGAGVPFAYTHTIANWSISGTSGNLVTLANDSTAGTNYFSLIKSGGGTITADYLSISRSTATPSNTWYAGVNSVDGGINNGWIFTGNPSTGRMFMFF